VRCRAGQNVFAPPCIASQFAVRDYTGTVGRVGCGLRDILIETVRGLPRPIVVDVLSRVLVMIGTFWFVGRSFA
jgi:hypothetical protein